MTNTAKHTPQLWDLDKAELNLTARKYFAGIANTAHEKFTVGQRITFWTGYNSDIRAIASIKAINGNDIYVYSDCYWFPIKDNEVYAIKPALAAVEAR